LIRQALETFEGELGPNDLQSLAARTRLARLLGRKMGRFEQAQAVLAGVVERADHAHGEERDVPLQARLAHAEIWNESGRYAEAAGMAAIEFMRDVVARRLASYGPDDPRTWGAKERLGFLLLERGDLGESTALTNEVYLLRREHLGDEHPDTLITAANIGAELVALGKGEEAVELLTGSADVCARELPAEHPTHLQVLNNPANGYMIQNDDARAAPLFRRVLELSA
jgi:hypothetical protein